MLEKEIAKQIRRLRTGSGLTLDQLAKTTGLSKSLLSRIENNHVSPPIATLSKIASALRVPIISFFSSSESEENPLVVTRKDKRLQVVRPGSKIGHTYYSATGRFLMHGRGKRLIEPFIVKFPVIDKEPKTLFDHAGEEFLLVLKGRMELVYGKEKVALEEGDSVHFDPAVPHRGQNSGDEECEALVVIINKE